MAALLSALACAGAFGQELRPLVGQPVPWLQPDAPDAESLELAASTATIAADMSEIDRHRRAMRALAADCEGKPTSQALKRSWSAGLDRYLRLEALAQRHDALAERAAAKKLKSVRLLAEGASQAARKAQGQWFSIYKNHCGKTAWSALFNEADAELGVEAGAFDALAAAQKTAGSQWLVHSTGSAVLSEEALEEPLMNLKPGDVLLRRDERGWPGAGGAGFWHDAMVVVSTQSLTAWCTATAVAAIRPRVESSKAIEAGRAVAAHPPAQIVRIFDETFALETQRLDFLWFLDSQMPYWPTSGVEEFRGSWRRPRWKVERRSQ